MRTFHPETALKNTMRGESVTTYLSVPIFLCSKLGSRDNWEFHLKKCSQTFNYLVEFIFIQWKILHSLSINPFCTVAVSNSIKQAINEGNATLYSKPNLEVKPRAPLAIVHDSTATEFISLKLIHKVKL